MQPTPTNDARLRFLGHGTSLYLKSKTPTTHRATNDGNTTRCKTDRSLLSLFHFSIAHVANIYLPGEDSGHASRKNSVPPLKKLEKCGGCGVNPRSASLSEKSVAFSSLAILFTRAPLKITAYSTWIFPSGQAFLPVRYSACGLRVRCDYLSLGPFACYSPGARLPATLRSPSLGEYYALQPESPRLLSNYATGLCRQSRMKSTLIKV